MSDIEADAEISMTQAVEGDGYHTSGLRQWAQVCGHMSSGEKLAFNALCSIVQEAHGWNRRTVTLSDIASCLPAGKVPVGQEVKIASISTVRHLLKGLAEIGQITAPDGSPLKVTSKGDAPMTILVHTYPRHECGGARNFRDSIAEARGEAPKWGPSATGDHRAPRPQARATGTSGPPRVAAPLQGGPPAPPAASDEAMDLAAEVLPFRKMRDVRRLAERIDAALGDGWTLEQLARMLKVKYRAEKVVDLVGFMVSRLPDPGETPSVKTGGRGKVRPLPIHDCPNCYGTGHEEDATGRLTGRKCLHPALTRPTPS